MIPLVDILTSVEEIYRDNSQQSDKYYRICNAKAKLVELVVRLTYLAFLIMLLLLLIFGMVDAILLGSRQPLVHFYLPHVYVYNGWLYVLVTVYDVLMVVIAALTFVPPDLLFLAVTANAGLTPAIVQQCMNEFTAALRSETGAKHDEIQQIFVGYMVMHQKFNT